MSSNNSKKGKIVVFGIVFGYPLAGVTYQFLYYLIGLRRLGYDPYYVEDSARSVYDPRPEINEWTTDATANIRAIAPILEAHGFGDRWAYRGHYPDSQCYGMTEHTYKKEKLQGQMVALAEQTLTALAVVQAFGREACEDRRFRGLSGRSIHATLQGLYSQLRFGVGVSRPTAAGNAAMLILGGLHVVEGSLTVGSLLVFLAYLNALYGPTATAKLQALTDVASCVPYNRRATARSCSHPRHHRRGTLAGLAYLSSGFASAAASSRRVFGILGADDGIGNAPGAKPLRLLPAGEHGHVCMENVTFGYEPGCVVVRGSVWRHLRARP